jgi:hypothetical protein
MASPQIGQNSESGGITPPQLRHAMVKSLVDSSVFPVLIPIALVAPQIGQNFASSGIIPPQFEHSFIKFIDDLSGLPVTGQNWALSGCSFWQNGHSIVLAFPSYKRILSPFLRPILSSLLNHN